LVRLRAAVGDGYAAGEGAQVDERDGAEPAAAVVAAPRGDRDRVGPVRTEDAGGYGVHVLWPDVVDVLPHVPAVDEDLRAVRARRIVREAQRKRAVLARG